MLAVPHDSIVPITDHGDDDGCPFVVMRFLPGGSLADYRRHDDAGSPIRNPPGMLNLWLPGVAAALDHIHAKGMLHRDVKPGNIFLDGFLKPYLGDFGIAKVVDESGGLQKEQTLTATKTAVGTPEYMAPELFKPRSKPDGRVDQYALAVTVYEMLSGDKPFKGDRAHIIVEHSALPVPPLAAKVPGLSQRVCQALDKGLAKSAADRFLSCTEFAAAVLAEVAELPAEPDTVRLLCPGCKNILKLPQKAAGKTGRCPKCREAMDVAADLASLWLEAEERGEGPAAVPKADETRRASTPKIRQRLLIKWRVVMLAGFGGFVLGFICACFVFYTGPENLGDATIASTDEEILKFGEPEPLLKPKPVPAVKSKPPAKSSRGPSQGKKPEKPADEPSGPSPLDGLDKIISDGAKRTPSRLDKLTPNGFTDSLAPAPRSERAPSYPSLPMPVNRPAPPSE